MNNHRLLERIRGELDSHANPVFRAQAAEYFGEDSDKYLGVRTPAVRKLSARYFRQLKEHEIDAVLKLCEALLKTGHWADRTIAFDWAFRCRRQYRPEHFAVFERWLEVYVHSWGGCDDLCTHALGDLVLRYPELVAQVKSWTHSQNRWIRRASAVSLVYAARKGKLLADIFEVADALLGDPDDMVQKGCGWLLKVASKTYEDEVFQYVMNSRAKMSRTTLRYAIEKMPADRRHQAMGKR